MSIKFKITTGSEVKPKYHKCITCKFSMDVLPKWLMCRKNKGYIAPKTQIVKCKDYELDRNK